MPLKSAIAIARTSRWLCEQEPAFRDALCRKLRPLALACNDTLFRVDENAEQIYFIAKGTVVAFVPHPQIGIIPGEVYHAGDWFGLPAALGRRPRLATIEARTDCDLLTVTLGNLLHMIRGNENAIRGVLALMSNVSESHMFHGIDLLISDLKLRLCSRLLTLAGRRLTYLPADGVEIPLSQEELALTSNMSRQTVHRLLGELVDAGICEVGYRRVVIRDTRALASILLASSGA